MKFEILSAVKNNSGYTLSATFYKRDKKILETGLVNFSIEEGISLQSKMNFSFSLISEDFLELCTKLNIISESFPKFFSFSKVHIQVFNSLKIPIREFSSYISEVHLEDSSFSDNRKLIFEARPLPWFMKESSNYRVYIEKTVEDIISDVFSDFEKITYVNYLPKFKLASPKRDTKRINCIQNGESDWDFILRLLDEEDWDFTFNHSKGNHELVINNDVKLINTIISESKYRNILFDIEDIASNLINPETNPLKEVISFQNDRLSNINFINFGAPVDVDAFDSDHRHFGKILIKKDPIKGSGGNLLVQKKKSGFNGTKKYKEKAAASFFIEHKKAALGKKANSHLKIVSGDTNSLKMYLGSLITAKYNANVKKPKTALLKEINGFRVEKFVFHFEFSGGDGFKAYSEIFMHPNEVEHNVGHSYHRKYIHGTLTGKVYGEEKQIYLDDMYFIKIQLPWQYDKYSDKADYIFARYMSPWANKSYGFFAIPRAGEEVIVAFENGDPDLPVVLGGLYNEKRPAPVDIKSKKHVLAIYDQPSENKKNNFLEMNHKTATVNIAAAEHMKIRSFGDHLTQSKLTMTMKTAKNMLSTSKEQMEFITDKNMISFSKKEMEFKTEKNMLHESKEQMEFKSEKNILFAAVEQMESKAEKNMLLESKEQMEFKSKKNILHEAIENIDINSEKEVIINVGSSIIKLDKSGNITLTGKKVTIKGSMGELEIK